MSETEGVDDLVAGYVRTREALAEIGRQIRASSFPVTVMFVDLVESTALKARPDDEWLGHVYQFVHEVSTLARDHGGTVVKRIGDEVMLTFSTPIEAESFLADMERSAIPTTFPLKIALDTGTGFFFRFEGGLEADPYGLVVDRCARIAKLATRDMVITTQEYVEACGTAESYKHVAEVPLKGLAERVNLHVRSLTSASPPEAFYAPLIRTLNDQQVMRESFKSVSRKFSEQDFSYDSSRNARPFLVRHLLTLPKAPWGAKHFFERLKNKPEEEWAVYTGYVVEWDLFFDSMSYVEPTQLLAFFSTGTDWRGNQVCAELPSSMAEIVRSFAKGDTVIVRGVITGISTLSVRLNYCDFSV